MENNERFQYTYCAARQQEIENIRKKYLPKEEDKLERLRKLHHRATRRARAWAITVGILGTLILGFGMSLILSELGVLVGKLAMPLGIVTGLAGLVLVALAYPVYNRVLENTRSHIAPEILRLTEELLQ